MVNWKLTPVLLFLQLYAAAQKPFAVVEFFTSEGCSSCPTADYQFSELVTESKQKGTAVYFLEYHVDYWNKAGWKDPFSKNHFTLRQENYSRVLPSKEMFTPQMVINGRIEVSGTGREAMRTALQKALQAPAMVLRIDSQAVANDTLVIKYSLDKADANAAVKFAVTENNLESDVKAGENKGRKLHHDAVVRIFYSTASAAKTEVVRIPLHGFALKKGMKLIGFVQKKQTMQILTATGMDL